MPSSRRFSPPWTLEENNGACLIVRDKNEQALGYFYFEDEPGPTCGGKPADQGRGAADGGELRQAAGAAAAEGRQPVERPAPLQPWRRMRSAADRPIIRPCHPRAASRRLGPSKKAPRVSS
jgi:hypothetical protein